MATAQQFFRHCLFEATGGLSPLGDSSCVRREHDEGNAFRAMSHHARAFGQIDRVKSKVPGGTGPFVTSASQGWDDYFRQFQVERARPELHRAFSGVRGQAYCGQRDHDRDERLGVLNRSHEMSSLGAVLDPVGEEMRFTPSSF